MINQQLVSLCLTIMNSVVVVGFYYGFLSTLSIGPSYLFLVRAWVMEEETEKQVSATTGFITGQLMMFISIYYAPMHLALSRPHTITFLTLPYLFFNFLDKNNKHYYLDSGKYYYLDSGYKNTNSMRKFSIHKVFFNNLLFQLINPLLFPSSILIRLVNIYLFRCNNKLLFLTSSFVGWLIGHIFLMKLIGFILVWLQQNNSINSIKSTIKSTIRFDKYILFKLRNYVGQIFVLISFLTFLHYLGRIPGPYFLNDDAETTELQENDEIEEFDGERDLKREEDLSYYLFPKEKEDDTSNQIENLERPIVTTLFDYQRWTRPLRYIQNDYFENVVRDENSQFFFHICQSDGKERISFTYPPHLSTFLKMMEKKIDLFTRDKISSNDLFNYWSSNNKEKRKKLSNEFYKRAKVLDKKFLPIDVLENRIRLCNDKNKREYLIQIYDPFLNGCFRGEMPNNLSIENEIYKTNSVLINKIHGILLSINSHYPDPEFEQKRNPFDIDRKSLLNEIGFFFNLISKFSEKSVSSLNFDKLYLFPEHEQVQIYSEEKKRKKKFLLDTIQSDLNQEKIDEISKQVPKWEYCLIAEEEELADGSVKEPQIRSIEAQPIVIFNSQTDNFLLSRSRNTDKTDKSDVSEFDEDTEYTLLKNSREPDFNRELIKGSMRPLRRKTVTWKLFQSHPSSPVFLEQTPNIFFGDLFDDIHLYVKEYFRKNGTDNSEFLDMAKRVEEEQIDEQKYDDEKRLLEIEESWESILYGLILRSFVILLQSFIRKYIILPSLIITKNIIRMILFQYPEWSEDFRDWKKEVHIKCTYQGIPVSDKALPNNWFTDGLQIRILSPFVLKPWHKSKLRSTEKKKRSTEKKNVKKNVKKKNLLYLTACGTLEESYLDTIVPNPFSFLGPILKKIKKQLKKNFKNRFFIVLQVLNERKKWFLTILKEIEKWNIKSILFRFQNIYELGENKKNSTISKNNPMIYESPVLTMNWTKSSLTEKRIKDLNVKTKTIITEIEKMTNEGGVLTSEKSFNSNKTTYDAKRFELQKNILQILQGRIVRLTRKSYSFFKFFMERVYVDILLCIIGIPRINIQLFLESTKKKIVTKSISNKKTNAERIDKTHRSIIPFMSIIDKSCNITNTNSENSCDVSSLSQAYVFFKLSQIQVINGYKYKLRSIFESNERSFFLKNEIKNYFFRIFNSKLRHKNRPHSVMNQWTNWLKVHYQYDLPESRWSRLVPQRWRKRIKKHRVAQNKDLINYDSYEKTRLILYKNENEEVDLFENEEVDLFENEEVDLLNCQKKIKKQYRYDLLSYKYLNYADKKNSYIYGYRSSNDNTCKKEFFDITGDISIKNYVAEDAIIDMEKKNLDRKYFDWMVMNVEIPNRSISKSNPKSNPKSKFWFFSKLSIFYDAYQKNPWLIPIKSLILPLYGKGVSKNKDGNFDEKPDAGPLGLSLSRLNQAYEDSYWENGSNSLKREDFIDIDRNNYPNHLIGEHKFFVDKYLTYQLKLNKLFEEEAIMDQIQFYCLMIRLKISKKFLIRSIKRGEIDMEIMAIDEYPSYTEDKDNEWIDKDLFIVEPIRLSKKNYEQFFMYQTINLSLIHKNKREIFQRNPEKGRVDKKNFDKNITRTRNQKIKENKDKNHTDLLVPENLLSNRRRRELRILICLNPQNTRKTINCNENKINTGCQVVAKNKDLDIETKKLMNLKFFLWPNYRLEDLACINRYWFDTQNGSRFSILRIHMYPRLKI